MSKLVSQVLPLSSQHPQYKGLHLHRSIVFTHFFPIGVCAHVFFDAPLFETIRGPELHRCDVVRCMCFFRTYIPIWSSTKSVYNIQLDVERFLSKNVEQCVLLSKWLVFHWVKCLHCHRPVFFHVFLSCTSCAQFCETCLSSMLPNF